MNIKILSNLLVILFTSSVFAGSHSVINKSWQILGSVKTKNFTKDLKKIHDNDIDIAGVDRKNNIIDLLLTDYDFIRLQKMGFSVEITETRGVSKALDPEYKNPLEVEKLTEQIHHRFPHLTKRISIGKSIEGRDIWALKISDNPETDEVDEPTVLFNSMHHAREVMTTEVAIDIIETLLNGYNNDSKITSWVNENEIWVIPMLNVDGSQKMWDQDRWWRKNTRGGFGVDLNRNYPATWDKCRGSSGRRFSQTYRGEFPASEPETQAMMKFVSKIRPVFNISYHSYSELVLYPYGCSPHKTLTQNIVENIGDEMGRLLNYESGTPWELLYNADGGDIDWMYEEYQIIPYVIEVSSRKEGFHPDYKKWRDKTVVRNRVGWQYLLDRLAMGGIRGQLMNNAETVSNFKVNVHQINSKKTFYQTYIGQENGVFHIVLEPGKYELEFIVNNKIKKKIVREVKDKLLRTGVEI